MALTDRLPSLTALRAFDAAARHMSFSRAADELHVTPAALSFQIKSLEEELGVPLFRRLNRAVELTEAGRALAPGARQGFEALRHAVRAVSRLTDSNGLTITAGPAFTSKWLAPRVFHFVEKRPDIDLRIVASLKRLDFERDEIDAAIRFSRRDDEPGCYVETLIHELISPVCAPEVAARLKTPQDLAGERLIHDDSMAMLSDPPTWGVWLKAAGADFDWRRGPRFSNADPALTAAVEGGGVALGRLSLAETDLAAGRLVTPFPLAIDTGAHFNFICPEGWQTRPAVAALLDWLREELADEGPMGEGMEIVSVN